MKPYSSAWLILAVIGQDERAKGERSLVILAHITGCPSGRILVRAHFPKDASVKYLSLYILSENHRQQGKVIRLHFRLTCKMSNNLS